MAEKPSIQTYHHKVNSRKFTPYSGIYFSLSKLLFSSISGQIQKAKKEEESSKEGDREGSSSVYKLSFSCLILIGFFCPSIFFKCVYICVFLQEHVLLMETVDWVIIIADC